MRVKHTHTWAAHCTFSGGMHGNIWTCSGCGSRKAFGAEMSGQERLLRGYARRGEPIKWRAGKDAA